MNNISDDELVIDQRVKTYQSDHPGTSYRAALTALLGAEQATEQKTREEFDRRVEHQVNAGFKS